VRYIQPIGRLAILHWVERGVSRTEDSLSKEIETMRDVFAPFAIYHGGTYHVDLIEVGRVRSGYDDTRDDELTAMKLVKHRDTKLALYSKNT